MKVSGLSFWLLVPLTLFLLFVKAGPCEASGTITLPHQRVDLAKSLRYLADADESLSPAEAMQQVFTPFPRHDRLEELSQGVYWILSSRIINIESESLRYFLRIRSNSQFDIDVFLVEDLGVPKELSTIPLRHPSYEVQLEPDRAYQFLIRATHRTHLWISPGLYTQESLWIEDRYENGLLTYCIGTLLTALLFHFAMFVSVRDGERAWFIAFIGLFLFIMVLAYDFPRGLQAQLNIDIQQYVIVLRTALLAISVMFLRSVFQTSKSMPKLDLWAKGLVGASVVLALTQLAPSNFRSFIEQGILPFLHLFGTVFNLVLIGRAIALGFRPAILILIGWLVISIGGMIRVFADPGFFELNLLVLYSPIISLTIQSLLVSVALGFKFSNLKINEQLAKRKKEEARKLKFFLRVICHDLANPLSVAAVAGNLLSKKYPDEKLIHKLTKSTKLMTEIVDYVRSSELYHGSMTKMSKVKLRNIIEEVLVIFSDKIQQKNIEIRISVDDDLYVFSHETNLKMQVLANLISNAIKFSPEFSIISLNARAEEDQVQLEISDSGHGISSEIIQALTNANTDRIHPSLGTNGEMGSGFGLSLAMEAIHKCGGKMKIESPACKTHEQNQKGTKITLSLPAANSGSPYAKAFTQN